MPCLPLRLPREQVRLGRFLGMLDDPSGDYASEIERACCALSNFSCDELEVAFGTAGKILPRVSWALTERTRSNMNSSSPT